MLTYNPKTIHFSPSHVFMHFSIVIDAELHYLDFRNTVEIEIEIEIEILIFNRRSKSSIIEDIFMSVS